MVVMNEQDKRTLELFDRQVKELHSMKLLEKDRNINLTISGKQGEAIKTEVMLFDEEQIRSFLLAFRPLYMNNEDIYFYKVPNIVYQCLDTESAKEQLAKCRKDFSNILDRPSGQLIYNNQQLTPRRIIDLWFNAYYFHKDQNKIREFNQITSGLGPMFRFFFQDSLCGLINCILWLGTSVSELLKQNSSASGG